MKIFQLVAMGIDKNSGLPREIFSKTVFSSMEEAQQLMEEFYYTVLNEPLDENHPIGIRVFDLELYDGFKVRRIENMDIPLLCEDNLRMISEREMETIGNDILHDIYEILDQK